MSQDLQSVLDAARQLPLNEQWQLVEALLDHLQPFTSPPAVQQMQLRVLEQEDW